MDKLARSTGSLLLAAGLAGCTSPGLQRDDQGKALVPRADAPALAIMTQVCPLARVPTSPRAESALIGLGATVVGAIATSAVAAGTEVVVDAVADQLEARALALTASTVAHGNNFLYTIVDEKGKATNKRREVNQKDASVLRNYCLILIRTPRANIELSDGLQEREFDETTNVGRINRQLHNSYVLYEELDFAEPIAYLKSEDYELYAEFLVQVEKQLSQTIPARDARVPARPDVGASRVAPNTSVRFGLRPVYLDYKKSGARRNGERKKLVVETLLQTPKAEGGTQVLHQDLFDFGLLAPGAGPLDKAALVDKRAKLAGLPAYQPLDGTAPDGSKIRVHWLVPVEAVVTVTESEDGGDYERLFAEKLRGRKEELSKAAVNLTDEQVKRIFGVDGKKEQATNVQQQSSASNQ